MMAEGQVSLCCHHPLPRLHKEMEVVQKSVAVGSLASGSASIPAS